MSYSLSREIAAMNNMPLNAETRQLEVLVRVSSLLSTLNIDHVLNEVVRLTVEVVGATTGSFFLLNDQGNEVTLQRFLSERDYNPDQKQYVSQRVLQEGLAAWVIANQDAALIEDTLTDPRWLTIEGKSLGARSALCVPFMVDARVYGILTLEHPEPGHFLDSDRRIARAVADQAGAAMRNAQLFDITQAQQKQLANVLNSTTEALFTVDLQGRIELINTAAEEVLHLSNAAARGHSLDELSKYSDVLAEIVKVLRDRGLTGGRQRFEITNPATKRDYDVSISAMGEEQSGEIGYVVSLNDVSSFKDLNRLKTHLLQMASHDLKNPLGVLLGYLDMLREDVANGIMPDPVFVEGMLRGVERMETLIQTLLSQERIEMENTQIRQRIDPAPLLYEVIVDMRPSADAKQHRLSLDIADQLAIISGDPVELKEAMVNLVGNAIKYTPAGGLITIRMVTEDQRLYFSVIDTGLGVPESQQGLIFEKYFRAKTAATDGIEGTGIGLSLVKEIVERHGGKVWFQSEEGVGSTFGFWIPVLN